MVPAFLFLNASQVALLTKGSIAVMNPVASIIKLIARSYLEVASKETYETTPLAYQLALCFS